MSLKLLGAYVNEYGLLLKRNLLVQRPAAPLHSNLPKSGCRRRETQSGLQHHCPKSESLEFLCQSFTGVT
jgi:hypothetical protein